MTDQRINISTALKTWVMIGITTLSFILLLQFIFNPLIPKFIFRDEVFYSIQGIVILFFSIRLISSSHSNTFSVKSSLVKPVEYGKLLIGFKYFTYYLIFLLCLIGILTLLFSIVVNHLGEDSYFIRIIQNKTNKINNFDFSLLNSMMRFCWYFFVICFLVPFSEEIFFRKILYISFRTKFSIFNAAVISAIIFAIGHIHNPIMALIAGLYLAYVYERERSLTVNVVIHSMINIFSILTKIFV